MRVLVLSITKSVTYLLKILVRDEGKSELGATPDDTSRATFPQSLKAFFPVWTMNGNRSIKLVCGGRTDKKKHGPGRRDEGFADLQILPKVSKTPL